MPVEIKELVIRAIAEPAGPPSPASRPAPPPATIGRDNREAIIQACVKRVLRILERSRER